MPSYWLAAILAALHPSKHNKDRTSNYLQFIEEYDFSKCRGIVTLRDISWFERRNNITVNVYSLDNDDETIIPLKVSLRKEKSVNLLLFRDHYYCITNFSRFLGSAHGSRRHYCYFCLYGMREEKVLNKHIEYCKSRDAQRVQLPRTGNIVFSQFEKMLKILFIVYADFETFVQGVEHDPAVRTFQYQSFEACSYSYIIVDWKQNIVNEKLYRGKDAAKNFLCSIIEDYKWVKETLAFSFKPLGMSDEDELAFKAATHCHICEDPFDENESRVRDHDHLDGKFRGAAHVKCNVNYRHTSKLPIVFHNLKNFDAHIIVQALETHMFRNVHVISHSIEKFIAMMMDDLVFIDSFAFLSSSLDNLAKTLTKEQKQPFFEPFFEKDKIPHLLEKGALPYEYIDT
ncbi:uncharacterized protein LOC141857504 [Brevipalpus obovatus]|uniref:uncharacterized protein LOC141857504 n=1 Tax=Brevipalpus obovatus TaxID=246614 RepID=UPI003D9F394D